MQEAGFQWRKRLMDREMPNATIDDQGLPTKDLFNRFVKLRDSTRWSAFYLFAVAALLLAWSRSPEWSFKLPFDLFMVGREPLAVRSGFAPTYGPLIVLFFYINLFRLHRETLSVGKVLTGRIESKSSVRELLGPPFELRKDKPVESILFLAFLLGATSLLTIWLLGDYLFLTVNNDSLYWSLFGWGEFWGIVPDHRGRNAETPVYGFVQSWLFVFLTIFELSIFYLIFRDTQSYYGPPRVTTS